MKMYTSIWIGFLLVLASISCRAVAEPVAEPAAVRLVPPWELPGPLVVVWPEGLSRGRRMIPAVVEFIQALPDDLEVALASPRPPPVSWLQEIGRDMRYLPVTTVRSREVGEWAGVAAATAEGRLFSLRPQLPLRDVSSRERARRRDDYEAARQLGRLLTGTTEDLPLRMERLHLTHNGQGVALVSNRVIADNEGLSLVEIRARLQDQAGLDTVVFVPVPEGDAQGYIDGVVRFVGPRHVLVAEPVPGSDTAREQHRDLQRLLQRELPEGIEVIRVPRPRQNAESAPPPSYLHMIQAGDRLLCPQYGAPEDRPVITLLQRQLEGLEVVPVRGDHVSTLQLNRIGLWH